jgi:hypothetical protein
MIAILQGQMQVWLPASMKLLARTDDLPFAFDVQVCCCHGFTWVRMENSVLITVVRWSD